MLCLFYCFRPIFSGSYFRNPKYLYIRLLVSALYIYQLRVYSFLFNLIASSFRRESQKVCLRRCLNFLQCLFCSLSLPTQFRFLLGVVSNLSLSSPVPLGSFAFLSASLVSQSRVLLHWILLRTQSRKRKTFTLVYAFLLSIQSYVLFYVVEHFE